MTYHGKKRKRKILTKIHVGEVSAVKVPANEHAQATIMKGLPLVTSDPYLDEKLRKRAALTTASAGHTHLVHVDSFDGGEMNSGFTSWEDDHSHPWVREEDGTIKIGRADGHVHSIAVIGKNIPKAAEPAATEGLSKTGDENNDMTPEEIQKKKEEFEAMQKRAEAAEKLGELNDAQREYRKNLSSDEDRDAFLAKSNDERQAEVDASVAKAAESDKVLYTRKDGTEIRKSQDPTGILASMAKENDEQADELKKSRDETEQIAFAKKAQDELSNTVGEEDVKIALLKCTARIADADMRGKVQVVLKAMDGAFKALTKSEGHGGTTVDANSAEAQLDALAKKIADEEKITKPQGMAKALRTPEGEALYAKAREESLV